MSTTAEQASTAVPAGPLTPWVIDPSHSQVEFTVKHMMISKVRGYFTGVSGQLILDDDDLAHSSVEVEIDTASVSTRDEKRDEHLRSAEFFDVEQYPTIIFKSTKVEAKDDDELRISGDLTIHGETRPVVLDATYQGHGVNPWGAGVISYEASAKISRRDFKMEFNVPLDTGGVLVGDDVNITIEIEASKQV